MARILIREDVKRVPVLAGERLTGIISGRNIVRVFARANQDIVAEVNAILSREEGILGRFTATVDGGRSS